MLLPLPLAVSRSRRRRGKDRKTTWIGRTHQEPSRLTLDSDSLAPYEKRVIELLRNSRDKRARKLAKKRVRLHIRGIRCKKANIDNITARYLRSCQEEGRRAPACHRRVPSCRSLNVTFRASTLDKQRHGSGLRFGVF